MKKTTKILSVLLALVMVFSCVPMTAFAAERDTSSLDAYLDSDNLAVVVETLLTDLGDRKEELVPTVLNFVFMLDQLKDKAAEEGVDVATADTEALADVLIAYADEFLAETDLNNEIKDFSGLIGSVLGGTDIDLNSVDGIIGTLAGALDYLKGKGTKFCGDAAKFSTAALYDGSGRNKKVITSANGASSMDIVNALFGFISDPSNISVIKTVIKGELQLGTVGNLISSFFDINEINETMKNLKGEINKMLYENLVAEWNEVDNGDGTTSKVIAVEYEASQYKSYTSDELLAAALVKLMTGEDVDKATAAATAKMTLNELIGEYGDYLIASFAIEPLNNDLKTMLNDLVNGNEDLAILKDILNLNYEFTVEDFNFTSLAESGIFEGLNDLICGIIEKLVQPAVAKELALKKGGNENITANLTSFCSYVLKTLSTYNGGKLEFTIDGTPYSYDFSSFTADKLAGMDLEAMIIEVANLLIPSLLGVQVPADADTLENLLSYAAYYAIDYYMVQPEECAFTTDYKSLVLNADGTIKDLEYTAWINTMGTMAMEVADYWLARAGVGYAASNADNWEGILEDIVDWALGWIAGIPAVSDELSIEVGTADGYGPWYKLNVIINELFALNFINDCGDETFVVDTYTLFIEKLVPSLVDCDFAAFANVLATNEDPESLFNKSVITGVLDLVDNLLFSLFEHDCTETASFTKAATATHDGYEGTYCVANGHYIAVTTTPATGVEDPDPTPDPTPDPDVPPVDDEPDYVPGDVTGDGEVTAGDARVVLRHSAQLELIADEALLLAADVDKNGEITAADARHVLRYSAQLIDSFDNLT
ncbi:MAG: dockerin type I repeat-containing protein [Clostridia bacterium]|nr:dockerin type I repeat-containing protein [Clostridia bacterium]